MKLNELKNVIFLLKKFEIKKYLHLHDLHRRNLFAFMFKIY